MKLFKKIIVSSLFLTILVFANHAEAALDKTVVCTQPGLTVPQAECEVLIDLYNATDGDNWFTNTNWGAADVNTWHGVTSGANVTNIQQRSNRLVGDITGINLGALSSLLTLELSASNLLVGDIGTLGINNLAGLTDLRLYATGLSGNILTLNLENLDNIYRLWFWSTDISGDITDAGFSEMDALTDLRFSSTNISGDIADAGFSEMDALTDLQFDKTDITGDIADAGLGNLVLIDALSISFMDLSGDIADAGLGSLINLESLEIRYNDFLSGNLGNAGLENLLALKDIDISYNQSLFGSIENIGLSNLISLNSLNLHHNQITGSIADAGLGSLTELTSLNLSNNQITGSIADAGLGSLTELTSLNLSNNQITGDIGLAGLCNFPNIESIYLQNNQISGDIALAGFENNTYIIELLLNNNKITGLIPNVFNGLIDLGVFWVNDNSLVHDLLTKDAIIQPALTVWYAGMGGDAKRENQEVNDADGDNHPDSVEYTDQQNAGTGDHTDNLKSPTDTDGDLVPDVQETADGTDTSDALVYLDTDGDLVPDYIELYFDSSDEEDDTSYLDTDTGGVPDYVETTRYANDPTATTTDINNIADDSVDSDDNGITDYHEQVDVDGDGVPNIVEKDAFNNGDGNGDDIPDVEQDEVSSMNNPVSNQSTSIAAAGDCTLFTNSRVVDESSLQAQDPTADYPLGLVDFDIECTTPGDSTTITIYYTEEYNTDNWSYKKYTDSGNEYSNMTDYVTFGIASVGGSQVTTVTYTLTDGDPNTDEDGVANGVIKDPSGPAIFVSKKSGSRRKTSAEIAAIFGDTDEVITNTTISEATTDNPFGGKLCSADLLITDNMKQGNRDTQYGSYNKGVVTQVNILQGHMNRLLLDEYGNQASGPVDGIFGPLTHQGVQRLQSRLNQLLDGEITPLIIDGIVGPFTKAAINMSC